VANISAGVAVYNGARHIRHALDSILSQTVPVDEILVVDDGSTDESAEIAASYPGVRVIRQPNAGIGGARRTLVENACGDWIAFCDHDDYWEPNRIEKGLPATHDEEAVLIYSAVWHVDENGVKTEPLLHATPDQPALEHLVPWPEDIWTSSTLLRREAIVQAGNFNPAYRSGEDMLMWFQLGSRGKIVQIPERLVTMFRRSDSTSSSGQTAHAHGMGIYTDQVLPNFDAWFAHVSEAERRKFRRKIERKVGYGLSILANHLDVDGQLNEAKAMHARALRMNPYSKGVWYRWARSLARRPGKPPI
jgi:glycosyltransferase involved in cell wall biosynthesis